MVETDIYRMAVVSEVVGSCYSRSTCAHYQHFDLRRQQEAHWNHNHCIAINEYHYRLNN